MNNVVRYLRAGHRKPKPNWISQIEGRFDRALASIIKQIGPALPAKVSCIMPSGGIRDITINRLLPMSRVDHHSERVPMASSCRGRITVYRRPHTHLLQATEASTSIRE